MRWRILDTGVNDGASNMAVDEAMLQLVREGASPPTLRFYAWDPAAVSLGYFQSLEKEIDLEACRKRGIDWVRRLTGGRAVLHDRELTYSIVAAADHPIMKGSVLESYLRLSEGILKAMHLLGVPAEVVGKEQLSRGESAACFEAPSWYEMVVDGKKLVGSAQTRKYGSVLQHGSVPLEIDAEQLYAVLQLPEKVKERLKKNFAAKAAGINDFLEEPVGFLQVKQAMIDGFIQALGWEFYEGTLTAQEQQLTEQLKEKYSSEEWNRSR